MIVLGLLLILVAAGTGVFAVVASSHNAQLVPLEGFGIAVSATPLAMYAAGAAAVLLLVFGFALVSRGTRHTVSSRRELRRLRKAEAASDSGRGSRSREGADRVAENGSVRGADNGTVRGADNGRGVDRVAGPGTDNVRGVDRVAGPGPGPGIGHTRDADPHGTDSRSTAGGADASTESSR